MAGRDTWSSQGTNKVDPKRFYSNSSIKGEAPVDVRGQDERATKERPAAETPAQGGQVAQDKTTADAPIQEERAAGRKAPAIAPVQEKRVENPDFPVPAPPYLALLSSVSAGEEALDLGFLLEERGTAVCYLLNTLSDVRKDPALEEKLRGAGAIVLALSKSDTFPRWWRDCPKCENTIFLYFDEDVDASVKLAATDQRVVRAYGYPDRETLVSQIARLLAASGVVDCATAGFEMPAKKRESLVGSWNYARNKLNAKQRALYDLILEKVKMLEPIKASDYIDEVVGFIPLVMVSIEADHPELFWIKGYQDMNPLTMFKATSRAMEEALDPDDDMFERLERMSDLNGDGRISITERFDALRTYALARAPEVLWECRKKLKPPSGWTYRSAQDTSSRVATMSEMMKKELPERISDYEILRFLFDCVCRRSWYEALHPMEPEDKCWCGSGKLYKNCHKLIAERLQGLRSVFKADESSAGKARMLQYLLLDFGIPCVTMSGSMMSGNREYTHTWNYVQIDGAWNIVDAAMGSCNVEKNPNLLQSCPDWAKGEYVRYWYLCADRRNYQPAPTIAAPTLGDTSDYFKNEGHLLNRDDVPSFVRSFAKLLCGHEAFIELKCSEDLENTSTWLTKNASVARGAFVAANFDYDRLCANIDMYVKASNNQPNVDKRLSSIGVCYGWSKWTDFAEDTITICLMERAPVRR